MDLSFEARRATTLAPTLAELAGDVRAVLSACGVRSASVVGHSLGAAVALHLASQWPQEVERLCACAASPHVGARARSAWEDLAGSAEAWDQNVMRRLVAQLAFSDGELNAISAPTLLLNAADDELAPAAGGELLGRAIPRAHVDVAPTGGHDALLVSTDALERLVAFLLDETPAGVSTQDAQLPRCQELADGVSTALVWTPAGCEAAEASGAFGSAAGASAAADAALPRPGDAFEDLHLQRLRQEFPETTARQRDRFPVDDLIQAGLLKPAASTAAAGAPPDAAGATDRTRARCDDGAVRPRAPPGPDMRRVRLGSR
eukprot:TRINITY_DN10927_c0_g1_i2.p1 TRINITY_DN10927_c0_g1~~TRINITY_DN10927_c0_g1_i2.p1  ORF type:complete len:318 (-),score=82.33 TRINITY_DN10927_c0_g1_i2:231-1184(-)